MLKLSQKNPRWAKLKINQTLDFGSYGCYVTCLAMLVSKTPDTVLNLLNSKNAFTKAGWLKNDLAAKILGFIEYRYCVEDPKEICIMETNYYAKQGFPQHFVVWLGNNSIIDPLDGKEKSNFYLPISFRVFKKKKEKVELNKIVIEKKATFWDRVRSGLQYIFSTILGRVAQIRR